MARFLGFVVLSVCATWAAAQIIGGGYKPGEVISKTDHSSVSSALDDVLKTDSNLIIDDRRVAIGVANDGVSNFINAQWYVNYGEIHTAAPPEVRPGQTALLLFNKKSIVTFGTEAVLTYDIDGTDYKVAIWWEVPYIHIGTVVSFNMKIYPKDFPTGSEMCKQMNKYAGAWKSAGWQTRTERGVELLGSITQNTEAKMEIYVNNENFSATLPTDIHRECDLNPLWFGSYCWRECTVNLGWCWANQKCSSADNCQDANLQCYSSCGQ